MNKILIILLALNSVLALSDDVDRSDWTENDFWEETNLNYDSVISNTITKKLCSYSVKNLIGCLEAFSKGLEFDSKKTFLVKYEPKHKSSLYYPFVVIDKTSDSMDIIRVKKDYYNLLFKKYSLRKRKLINANPKKILRFISKNIKKNKSDSFLASQMYNAYIAIEKDPHTYIESSKFIEKISKPATSSKGFGFFYRLKKYKGIESFIISGIVERSPAEKVGLLKGDIVSSVNGIYDIEKIISKLKESSEIKISIERDEENYEFEIKKAVIKQKNVTFNYLESRTGKYLYIKMRSFMDRSSCEIIREEALEAVQIGIEGVILDLRDNGGGLVSVMKCLVKLYLEPGSLIWGVEYLNRSSQIITEKTFTRDNIFRNLHTVTLVNGRSASASEALAMYLQDYRKSFVVGERTYGKGTMQRISRDQRNELISYGNTTAKYYGPKGISPQINGVIPDFITYPEFDQRKKTIFKREKDRFLFVIENEMPQNYIDQSRKMDIAEISRCIKSKRIREDNYKLLKKQSQLIFDNQLEKAKEILSCANERVDIFRGINLPNLSGKRMTSSFLSPLAFNQDEGANVLFKK